MCVREGRDERGRLLPGHSGNPRGRPPASRYARLLAVAAELGAVVVMLPEAQATADERLPAELPKVVA